jgi:hypothetical protein
VQSPPDRGEYSRTTLHAALPDADLSKEAAVIRFQLTTGFPESQAVMHRAWKASEISGVAIESVCQEWRKFAARCCMRRHICGHCEQFVVLRQTRR